MGQSRAINTLARTVTIAVSGLSRAQTPVGIYLLLGPSGTGKTHMARALAHVLHGGTEHLAVADCHQLGQGDELQALSRQVAPHFQYPVGPGQNVRTMRPHSILLIEHLEAAKPEFVPSLLGALEAGYLILPDGKSGTLQGTLVLMTSNLCAREIYGDDRKEIGFLPAAVDLEESEKARIYQLCATAVEKKWGAGLLGHLDDMIVFHRIREVHLPLILRRLLGELNRQLVEHRLSVALDRRAADYLLSRGSRFPHHGAWFLVKVFRRFIVFPLADMVSGHHLVDGGHVRVELDPGDRLRFTVQAADRGVQLPQEPDRASTIPIDWDESAGSLASELTRV